MQSVVRDVAAATLLAGLLVTNSQAQQSVTAELDSCINSEKMSQTLKGAAVGAVAGFLGSLAAGKKQDQGKVVLAGAVAGGVVGYVTAYYKAAGACIQKNPAWVPESKIQRDPNYSAVIKEFNYQPAQGDFSTVRPLQIPATVKPGQDADVQVGFVVLTPDGGESKVKIVRQLFAITDGKEEEVPFFGLGQEEKTVENGEHTESFKLPIGKEIPLNSRLRLQYSVSMKDAPFVSQSKIFEVK